MKTKKTQDNFYSKHFFLIFQVFIYIFNVIHSIHNDYYFLECVDFFTLFKKVTILTDFFDENVTHFLFKTNYNGKYRVNESLIWFKCIFLKYITSNSL